MTHCDLGSTPEILSVILRSDVSLINLQHNNIESLGAVKIAEYLESDPPIKRLFLYYNRLNDDDVILISQALKRNTNLLSIYLHSNIFTSIGVKAIINCLFDSSSLNAISESNHTLILISFRTDCNYSLDDCIDKLLDMDCTQKIVLALQDKDSLLQYLANVPVELIPELLAFPLRQVEDQWQHKNLNIVYLTMRWWNLTMLYLNCDCIKFVTKRKRDN